MVIFQYFHTTISMLQFKYSIQLLLHLLLFTKSSMTSSSNRNFDFGQDFGYISNLDEVELDHEEEEAMEIPNQEGGTFQTSSSVGASNTTISTTTSRAKRSKVWDHYEIEIKQGTNESFAVCKICKIRYSYKTGGGAGGTGTLRKHLVKIHKLDPENLQPLGREPTQQQINPFTANPFTITKEISRKAIVKFVTKCCLPFLIAEQEGFVEFTISIQPGFHNVSRHTLKK